MGFIYFLFGVFAGVVLLALLPLLVAILGVALAIGFVIALPLILVVMLLVGVLALTPALGYGLAIAALLLALWASDRNRRLPPPASGRS